MKHKFLFICLIIVIILTSIIIIFKKDTQEYLLEISYSEYKQKIDNKDSFIFYLKQDGCKHCQSFTPIFKNVLNEYKIKAYYINLSNITEEEYNSLSQQIDFEGTPTVVFIENGKELGAFSRISGEKSKDFIINKLKLRGYISE